MKVRTSTSMQRCFLCSPCWFEQRLYHCSPCGRSPLGYYSFPLELIYSLHEYCAAGPRLRNGNILPDWTIRRKAEKGVCSSSRTLSPAHSPNFPKCGSLVSSTPMGPLNAVSPFVRFILYHRQDLWGRSKRNALYIIVSALSVSLRRHCQRGLIINGRSPNLNARNLFFILYIPFIRSRHVFFSYYDSYH